MFPAYQISSPSTFPFEELNKDQLQLLNDDPVLYQASSSSSSLSYPMFFNPTQDHQAVRHLIEPQLDDQKAEKNILLDGSSGDHQLMITLSSSSVQPDDDKDCCEIFSLYNVNNQDEVDESDKGSETWMSPKMRLMHKVRRTRRAHGRIGERQQGNYVRRFHDDHQQEDNNNIIVRVCSDCNTTKTPLWRSGPQGPKSLCNACGIRQRKARRAMAAIATVEISGAGPQVRANHKLLSKGKKRSNKTAQRKKPFKLPTSHPRETIEKLSFEDFALSLISKSSTFRQGFPKDEEEAAILLMALSCGLIHS